MDALCVLEQRQDRQEAFWAWVDQKVRGLVRDLAEMALRVEMEARVQAGWNERTQRRRGYRNGFYRRRVNTPHGPLSIRVPRCRKGGLDCSAVFDRYERRIRSVDRIVRHAYLLGTATRATAQLAEQIFGDSLSHQTVSRVMRWLDEQLLRHRRQPIRPWYPVVFIDGMHVDVVGQDQMVMLVVGQTLDGRKQVLDFCLSAGEQCTELLWDLRRRGLENVELFVSDDAGAIRAAVQGVYPEVPWQSCSLHRLWTLRETVCHEPFRNAILREAARIFRCPSLPAALDAAQHWARRWRPQAPYAVQRFLDRLQDSLMFYTLPKEWWRRARTNNAVERLIRTLRIRLRPMGCFQHNHAAQRAVFGQLLRWHLIPKVTHTT